MRQTTLRFITALLLLSTGVSCTTAYDAYGRPQQVVDPSAALLGVAAAGLIGFALADGNGGGNRCNNNNFHRRGRWQQPYRNQQCNNGWF